MRRLTSNPLLPPLLQALLLLALLGLGPAAAAPAAAAQPAAAQPAAPIPAAAAPAITPAAPAAAADQRGPSHYVLTFRPGAAPPAKSGRFRLVRILAGAEPPAPQKSAAGAAVPVAARRAVALLDLKAVPPLPPNARAAADLGAQAEVWSAAHPPARIDASRRGDRIELTATGPNATGALTAFLASFDLRLDRWGAFAAFLGIAVGTETDGASLGIACRDLDAGTALRVSFLSLQEDSHGPSARLDLELPLHCSAARLAAPLHERTVAFARRSGVPIDLDLQPAHP